MYSIKLFQLQLRDRSKAGWVTGAAWPPTENFCITYIVGFMVKLLSEKIPMFNILGEILEF